MTRNVIQLIGKMDRYNNYDEQVKQFALAIKENDIKKYAGDGIWDLARFVLLKDPSSGFEFIEDSRNIIMSLPLALFWQKIQRFLFSCFKDMDDQVKFSSKFCDDDVNYKQNVKRLITAIDAMESEESIDYLAYLTRCTVLFNIHMPLYFRLVKCIQNCTTEELNYLKGLSADSYCSNNALVSMLLIQGLMEQVADEKSGSRYRPSSIGRALKECSLNYNDSDHRPSITTRYDEMDGVAQIDKHKVEMAAAGIFDLDEEADKDLISSIARHGWEDAILIE